MNSRVEHTLKVTAWYTLISMVLLAFIAWQVVDLKHDISSTLNSDPMEAILYEQNVTK